MVTSSMALSSNRSKVRTNNNNLSRLTTTIHLTLMMTSARLVETSVTTINNSPSQDYTHPDNQTTLLHVTSELKPFTVIWAQIKAHDCLQRPSDRDSSHNWWTKVMHSNVVHILTFITWVTPVRFWQNCDSSGLSCGLQYSWNSDTWRNMWNIGVWSVLNTNNS